MTDNELAELFENKNLLEQALTHKSWVNENKNKREHNERFEFLGDAILEFIVSKEIFNTFPDKEEGYLTALRANLVNTKNLASVARRLKIILVSWRRGGGRKGEPFSFGRHHGSSYWSSFFRSGSGRSL